MEANLCSSRLNQDFIEDDFNLTGLIQLVPFYKEAMEMILDVEPGPLREDNFESSRRLTSLSLALRGRRGPPCSRRLYCRVERRVAVRPHPPALHPDPTGPAADGSSPIPPRRTKAHDLPDSTPSLMPAILVSARASTAPRPNLSPAEGATCQASTRSSSSARAASTCMCRRARGSRVSMVCRIPFLNS